MKGVLGMISLNMTTLVRCVYKTTFLFIYEFRGSTSCVICMKGNCDIHTLILNFEIEIFTEIFPSIRENSLSHYLLISF